MIKKWLLFGLIIILLTCAECQEPDDSATRKYQDELFKSETTETTNTDINTTLSSTEIENNSTNTETNDAVDAANDLDENEELSSTRDEDQSSEWTTMPPTHEYSISINDVLKKSIDVVKDEMKGFGIIQSWLKEQANEFVSGTTTEDYDYTQTTDDYTVNEIYDDEEAGNGNGTTTEIVNVQKESEDLPPVENELNVKEESSTEKIKDTIEKIEDDLKKLNRVQAEEKEEEEEREEIIQDIEENLNKLEASSSHDQTTQSIVTELTTNGTTEFVEFEIATTATPGIILEEIEEEEEEQGETTTILMQPELFTTENAKMVEFAEVVFEDEETVPQATTTEREIVKEGTEKEEDTTVMITIIDEINSEDSITTISESRDEIEEETITVNIVDDRTVTTENIATTESVFITTTENITTTESPIITTEVISSEITTEGHYTTMIETTNAPSTTTEVEMEITTMPQEEIIIVTETETTVTEEKINENNEKEEKINENNEEDEEINENNEKEDEDVTLKNIPVTNVESTETNEIPSSTTESHNSYDIVNEVVDEIIHEIKENDLTSSTPSEEPTKISIDQFLHALNSNSMEDTNNNDNNEDSNELLQENKTEIASNEEVFDDIDKERKKILADHSSSEDNTLDDVELAVDVDQFSEEEVVEKVGDPKVSALITDRMDGNVCLNASGLSIKITANDFTQWVPKTARVFGECTSFGAYLNFTWRNEGKEMNTLNSTLSFTFIGDEEESYIEEVFYKTKKENFLATQLERYLTEPMTINLSKNTTVTLTHLNVKLYRKKDDYATISLLSVDNAMAIQIASGGLCLFIVIISVSIYSYKKLRSQARIFKVSLDK